MDKDRYPAEERRHFIKIYVENILSTVFGRTFPFEQMLCFAEQSIVFSLKKGGGDLH